MSLFSGIVAAEHTFVAWAEKELQELEKKAPTIEAVVETGIKYIAPALQIVLASVGEPAAAAAVTPIIAEIEKDLTAASALIYDFGASPTAASIFASVKANLGTLLSAGHITSDKSVAVVKKVIGEVDALASAISLAVGALTPAKAA